MDRTNVFLISGSTFFAGLIVGALIAKATSSNTISDSLTPVAREIVEKPSPKPLPNANATASLSKQSTTPTVTPDPIPTLLDPEPTTWAYEQQKDPMSGGITYYAQVQSKNSVELDFPYTGQQKGTLVIRNHPTHQKDIIFLIDRGQILCNSFQGCQVSIKFDNNPPIKVDASGPDDHSNQSIFLGQYNQLMKNIMTSKTMLIEVDFFQQGSHVFEFDVSNFNTQKFSSN